MKEQSFVGSRTLNFFALGLLFSTSKQTANGGYFYCYTHRIPASQTPPASPAHIPWCEYSVVHGAGVLKLSICDSTTEKISSFCYSESCRITTIITQAPHLRGALLDIVPGSGYRSCASSIVFRSETLLPPPRPHFSPASRDITYRPYPTTPHWRCGHQGPEGVSIYHQLL